MPTPYRADHVGSFLRPKDLLEARAAGTDPQRLRELEDLHIAGVLNRQKELGFSIFTDGELRRANFMSDFTDAVSGFYLVRPDGYLAYLSPQVNLLEIEAYLARRFLAG